MVCPPRVSRALAAAPGTLVVLVLLVAGALTGALGGPVPAAAAAAAPEVDDAPLGVRIDELAPSYLPARGQIEVRGTVTNRTPDTWTDVKLYAFMGDDQAPMTNAAQLAAATEVPYDADVGDRVTDLGEPGSVDELAPGETASWTLRVPVTAFDVSGGGVYWFGVHALGSSSVTGRDLLADGRARTFLPYVPGRVSEPLAAALVLPLTRPVAYAADGSLEDEEQWLRSLGDQGRLRDLLSFADAAGTTPLTWLADPALLDAVDHLARGNRPRDLGPSVEPGTPTGTDPTASPTPQASELEEEEPASPVAQAARAWLDDLPDALAGNEVLRLPYGNLDVPASLRWEPALLDVARAQSSTVLDELGVEARPALGAPSGFLDAASIRAADPETTVLVSDRLVDGRLLDAVRLDDTTALLSSTGAAEGSPGPGPRVSTVGLRQRILAEAAIRALRPDQPPLVVVLPTDWGLDDPEGFFAGLDADWLDLDPVADVADRVRPVDVSDTDLAYTAAHQAQELSPQTLAAASDLIEAGDTLQNVLADNNRVAGAVAEQALAGVAYSSRRAEAVERASLFRARDAVGDLLDGIEISTSEGVTLSGGTGTFVVTLTNRLEQRVVVEVRAEGDDELSFGAVEPVELAPESRTNVLLEARTRSTRVHNVRLSLTDGDGVPLGSSTQVAIRSAQVSEVIWLIMGTGAGLLFLAIAVRLVRRVRRMRRADADLAVEAGA